MWSEERGGIRIKQSKSVIVCCNKRWRSQLQLLYSMVYLLYMNYMLVTLYVYKYVTNSVMVPCHSC